VAKPTQHDDVLMVSEITRSGLDSECEKRVSKIVASLLDFITAWVTIGDGAVRSIHAVKKEDLHLEMVERHDDLCHETSNGV
jgi:hypothetical protein